MDFAFYTTRQNHKIFYSFLKGFSPKQLGQIPEGFRNSMFWNIAHVVVTQQKLVYGLSGKPLPLGDYWVEAYQKGTAPAKQPSEAEIEELKELLFSTLDQTEKDYEAGMFTEFKTYMTSAKVELASVEQAIQFNLFHEGLHMGTLLAMQKLISTDL